MIVEFLFLSCLAILFWFTQKIADWHNEHWLNWFKWAWILFWIIWGTIWFFLMQVNEIIMVSYLAILLYWIYKLKIDYTNHAISIIIILFWVFLAWFEVYNYYYVLVLLIWYVIFDFVKQKFKGKWKYFDLFFKYRLQFVIIPCLFALYIQNILWIVIVFNLVGVSLANYIFKIK